MGIPADMAGVTTTTVSQDLIWTSTGRYSIMTHQDCQGDDSKGCYCLEHFARY